MSVVAEKTVTADEFIKRIDNGENFINFHSKISMLEYNEAVKLINRMMDEDAGIYLTLDDKYKSNIDLAIKAVKKFPSMLNYIPEYKKRYKDFMIPVYKAVPCQKVLLSMNDKIFCDKEAMEDMIKFTKAYIEKSYAENKEAKKDWEENHSYEYAFPGYPNDIVEAKKCLEILSKKGGIVRLRDFRQK